MKQKQAWNTHARTHSHTLRASSNSSAPAATSAQYSPSDRPAVPQQAAARAGSWVGAQGAGECVHVCVCDARACVCVCVCARAHVCVCVRAFAS